MRFLLDENVERRIAEHLEATGHDVAQATSAGPAPLSDHEVVRTALRPGRILVTRDRDFGQLVFELGDTCPTILLRFKTNDPCRPFAGSRRWPGSHPQRRASRCDYSSPSARSFSICSTCDLRVGRSAFTTSQITERSSDK